MSESIYKDKEEILIKALKDKGFSNQVWINSLVNMGMVLETCIIICDEIGDQFALHQEMVNQMTLALFDKLIISTPPAQNMPSNLMVPASVLQKMPGN